MAQPLELGTKKERFALAKLSLVGTSIFMLILAAGILFGESVLPSDLVRYIVASIIALTSLIWIYRWFNQLWVDIYEGGLIKTYLFGKQEVLLWRDVSEVEIKELVTSERLRKVQNGRIHTSFIIRTNDNKVVSFSIGGPGIELSKMLIEGVRPYILQNTLKELDDSKEIYLHELVGYNSEGVLIYPPGAGEKSSKPQGHHVPWSQVKAGFDGEYLFIKPKGNPLVDLPLTETVNFFIFFEIAQRNNIKIERYRGQVE